MSETFPNPPDLAARYEIRRLNKSHNEWAAAIVSHSNVFSSPFWPVIYPTDKTARAYKMQKTAAYLVSHQIESNISFGVFDREYEYKNPESAATGGKLYWDASKPELTGDDLLAQMDFPLVSIALAFDAIDTLDMPKLLPLLQTLPLFATVYTYMGEKDTRPESVTVPTGPRQILNRNATSTRQDYEGQRIMGALARFLMREAKGLGFRAIRIEAAHDAVAHVWLNPPAPFKGELIVELDSQTYEEEGEDGVVTNPFSPGKQILRKIWVTL